MIPIQLTIEGLYSYQHRQTINFSALTEAGLFGIFGTVGSGKSSILEAISFALYGETERMNSKEKRAYNMMNLKSDKSYIEFDFYNHENEKFRVVRSFKRNSKKFDDVKSGETTFYHFKDGSFKPLDHCDAEKIIGLSYSNFKRTIIIPQGQFKEFLELGATERTRMMKEIFNLHKYDLQDKTAALAKDNKSQLDHLEGQLSGFAEVSEEVIDNLTLQYNQQKATTEIIQKNFDEVNAKFQHIKSLKNDFESLQIKKQELIEADEEKLKIDEEEKKLREYEKVHSEFHALIKDKNTAEQTIKDKTQTLEKYKADLENLNSELETVEKNFVPIKTHYANLAEMRYQELDLAKIIQTLGYQEEIENLKQRSEKGRKEVEKVEIIAKNLQDEIKSIENTLTALLEKRTDPEILLNLGQWFAEHKNLKENFKNRRLKVETSESKIKALHLQLEAYQIPKENYEAFFESEFKTLKIKEEKLQHEKQQILVQQQLSHYADNLHNGEACPLCGSHEHPNIVKLEDVAEKLKEVEDSLSEIEKAEVNLNSKKTEVSHCTKEIALLGQQLEIENLELSDLNKQLVKHTELFVWPNFDPENEAQFILHKQEALALEEKIKTLRHDLQEKRKSVEEANNNVKKYETALHAFEKEENEKATQIQQNISNLSHLKFEDYKDSSKAEVGNLHATLQENMANLERDYKTMSEKIQQLTVQQASTKATVEQLKSDFALIRDNYTAIVKNLDLKLKDFGIESLDILNGILEQKYDTLFWNEKIKQFRIQYETLKNVITVLEQKFQEQPFDNQIYETEEQKLSQITHELKDANAVLIKFSTEIQRLSKAFEDKKELLQRKSELQKRADNLKVLTNLFKGAGFVQYVSSIYLRQLCDHANIRFHRMTRNQLSLQLNDNHDFEIIDYLNEGRSRSVKTLSGGQAFQVSLSLALALAESVQRNAQADKNFFFIDEGFGTQDADSINIVFETLQSLQKENRIVGIISHVEELKERIPVSLQVNKDEERGSIIDMI